MENNDNLNNIQIEYSKLKVLFIIYIQIICLLCLPLLVIFIKLYYQDGLSGVPLSLLIWFLIFILIGCDTWGSSYSKRKIDKFKLNNQLIPKSLKVLKITSSIYFIIIYFLILTIFR